MIYLMVASLGRVEIGINVSKLTDGIALTLAGVGVAIAAVVVVVVAVVVRAAPFVIGALVILWAIGVI